MAKSELYKKAGVDIDTATRALKSAKKFIKSTFNKNVGTDIGSFGGVYKISKDKYVVASTDGVGTKLKIAQELGIHHTVGEDIVNHCVNDILVMGARPLFFLDYFGTGKLEAPVLVKVIKGLSKACRENGCVLIGGETAEMPGIYKPGDYDLVGTIVGEVAPGRIVTGKSVKPGDVVLGLGSSGLHTNGYSLARRVFETAGIKYTQRVKELGTTLGTALLKPHRSYLNSVWKVFKSHFKDVHSIAHITGGGFYDNIVRVLPDTVDCEVVEGSWKVLPVFSMIQKTGKISKEEMHRVFNMGIGLVVIVSASKAGAISKIFADAGEKVYKIGKIVKGSGKVRVI